MIIAENMCGLLVLKEELFRDLFVKKRLFAEKKEQLTHKGQELSFLKGLISGRKKLKAAGGNYDFSELEMPSIKVEQKDELSTLIENGVKIEEGASQVVNTTPRVFKIPFYLLKADKGQVDYHY